MKVLIACEYSGIVREAFKAKGHYALSCDLLPTSIPGNHYTGDIFDVLYSEIWDIMIAFPPCTHLSGAGAPSWKQKQKDGRQQSAINFVVKLWQADNCKRICIENPTGILSTVWRKPAQIINPFQFGQPFKKRTCLWLKNLPLLTHTNIIEPAYHYTSNSTRGGLLKNGTRKKSELPIRKAWDNSHERSRSFEGIALAMSEQWG